MFNLWMDYICVCTIKLMLKLKAIPKRMAAWQRERTGISASLRTLTLVLCASTFLCGHLAGRGGGEAVK